MNKKKTNKSFIFLYKSSESKIKNRDFYLKFRISRILIPHTEGKGGLI